MEIINWRLMSHPINWVVLFLMIFIASMGIALILNNFGQPGEKTQS